ncbi:MAG: pallilysin-related adhesin [Spirochaetia bacterium]
MRFRLSLLFLFLLLFGITNCTNETGDTRNTVKGRHIIPGGTDEIIFSSAKGGINGTIAEVSTDSDFPLVKVSLSDSYIIIDVVNNDLDTDENDEQIIAVKKKGDESDAIYLIAVDYSEVRGGYMKVWEEKTGITNVRTFNIFFDDVSGDHTKEIICTGLNETGDQVLNIYRRNQAPLAFSISFQLAADIICDGTIEIQERERSSAYENGHSDGASYPIITYSDYPESEDEQDLLMTTYMWKLQENGYVKVREERISGANIVEEKIREISRGDKDTIEAFISGPWYRSTGSSNETEDILIFDLRFRTITFYSEDQQEHYAWKSSYKRRNSPHGPGLDLLIENKTMQTKVKGGALTVTGTDSLVLNLYHNDEWDGTYRRLTKNLQKAIIEKYRHDVTLSDASIQGLYKNENGIEYFFAEPRYVLRTPDEYSSGGYVLYEFLGYLILELVQIGENGLIEDRYTYILNLETAENEQRIIRRIELIPADVTARKVEQTHGDKIKVEQAEEKK